MVGWKCFSFKQFYICVCWDYIFNFIFHSSLLLVTDWPPGFARRHQEDGNAGRTNFTDLRPLSYGHLQSGAAGPNTPPSWLHIMELHPFSKGTCSDPIKLIVQLESFTRVHTQTEKKGFTTGAEPSYHPSFPSKPSSTSHQRRFLRIKFTLPPWLLAPVCRSDCYSSDQHSTVVLSCLLFGHKAWSLSPQSRQKTPGRLGQLSCLFLWQKWWLHSRLWHGSLELSMVLTVLKPWGPTVVQ